MTDPTHEVWRPVAGHEGYEVSDLGCVRSWRGLGKAKEFTSRPRLLKGSPTAGDYLLVSLQEPRRRRYIHHLVAEAFVGPRPAGMYVCHGNGNQRDNRAVNLRYDTQLGNMADCVTHGTRLRGETVWIHKLTDDEVTEIREIYFAGGVSQRELAARYGVVQQTISKTIRGEFWAHVEGAISTHNPNSGRPPRRLGAA